MSNHGYWKYRAECEHVVDGDTVDIRVDLGFKTYKIVRVRLSGVDTAEIYGVEKGSDEYEKGMRQTQFVIRFLTVSGDWPITFKSEEESGKYGRWLGDLSVDGTLLTEALINEWPEVKNE